MSNKDKNNNNDSDSDDSYENECYIDNVLHTQEVIGNQNELSEMNDPSVSNMSDNPQKFFTVKVFDNLLKSYNIKGIENNDNKKNKNEKCIKKIDNKNTNKKDDFKKTFLKIKEYFVEENSYINDE